MDWLLAQAVVPPELVNLGSAGAVIAVVIVMLKHIQSERELERKARHDQSNLIAEAFNRNTVAFSRTSAILDRFEDELQCRRGDKHGTSGTHA